MPCQQNSAGRMSLPALELVKKSIFDKLSNETHCTGLSFEKAAARRSALAYARTFASRKVYSPTYTPPEKMI